MTVKATIPVRTADDALQADESEGSALINLEELDAILVDLDGVVTETARIHAQAWKTMFDAYLRERAARLGDTYEPFDLRHDYKRYVDGKPRYDGVASFLQSRSIYLPPGEDSDPPDKETIRGLGNRKNKRFLEAIRQRGVKVYQTSIDFIGRVKSHGLRVAVVTSSRNCRELLEAAGIGDLFDAQVDGLVAREWMLDGKPAPGTYLEAARRLGVTPRRAAVIEDAVSGVQAGKAGRFGLVIGVSRNGQPELLRQSGADIVVSDLSELRLGKEEYGTSTIPPLALEELIEIRTRIDNRRVAVFLDYDGTLTPIVERPELAILSEDMRATLKALADRCTVVVISGRERSDVERLVGLNNIIYAGCHGFDIAGPKGTEIQHKKGAGYVPVIAQAARELDRRLASIENVIVENKTYAVAVHFRMVRAEDVGRVEHIVDSVLAQHTLLRKTRGKKVFELRPNMAWGKGKAVLWLLDALGLNEADVMPFYLGDDVTDCDAFEALQGKGISILVAEQPQHICADYRLSDTAEVRKFLNELTAVLSERER
jgi:alpha,alpha-trehalase